MDEASRVPVGPPPGLPLAVAYDKSTGEMMVYGGFFFAALFALVAVMTGGTAFLVPAVLCGFCSFYFQPYAQTRTARLIVEQSGLFIQGLGMLKWPAIADVSWGPRAVRSIPNPIFRIETHKPFRKVLIPDPGRSPLAACQTRCWRAESDTVLRIFAQSFDVEAPQIAEAIAKAQAGVPE